MNAQRRTRTAAALLPLLTVIALSVSCAADTPRREQEEMGRRLIARHGCGACHVVPGVRGARGLVGPPLDAFGRRVLIAGSLPNTAANLERFIADPQQVEPGTAMPDLDISSADSRAMAAYLHTLR